MDPLTSPYAIWLRGLRLLREEVPSFEEYPFCLPATRQLEELTFRSPVTFLVGENGSGKSTLLEAIAAAWGFNPEGGSRNFLFATQPSHSALHEHLRLIRNPGRPSDGFFLRAESFYNVATEVEKSQFIIATHSPILMGYPGAEILLLDQDGIRRVDYEETEHYVITREFLNSRERMLLELFSEPPA